MRTHRRFLFPAVIVGALAVAGAVAPPAWAEESHPGGLRDTCPEVLSGSPTGDLEKRTRPSDGSDVRVGDVVTVTLRWDPRSFGGPALHKVLDCVTVDGELSSELSGQERDAPNDGLFEWRFTVPAGVPVGARICDRGFVSGPGPGDDFERLKSNDVCFTVAPLAGAGHRSPSPAAPPPTVDRNDAPPVPPAPAASPPPGPSPDATPDSATPDPRSPEAVPPAPETVPPAAATVGPGPTETVTPGADRPSPPVAVLSSPLDAPAPDDVVPGPALPRTGSDARPPLVLGGLVLGAGGAGIMTGAGRRPRRRPV